MVKLKRSISVLFLSLFLLFIRKESLNSGTKMKTFY